MYRFIPLAALVSLLFLCACNNAPVTEEEPVRPVKTMVVSALDLGREWTFAGTAEDALATDLSFRVGGKIISFPGDQIGRKFSKGAVIARLDPSDYELELRQAKANLETGERQLCPRQGGHAAQQPIVRTQRHFPRRTGPDRSGTSSPSRPNSAPRQKNWTSPANS